VLRPRRSVISRLKVLQDGPWFSGEWSSIECVAFKARANTIFFTGMLTFENLNNIGVTLWNGHAHIYVLRETAFARMLRSTKTWLASSLLQYIIFNMSSSQRLQDFSLLSLHVNIASAALWFSRLTLLFPARFCCLGRTPAHSGGYPSLDTARSQYSIGSCTGSFCLVRFDTVFPYVTDQMLYRVSFNVLFQIIRDLVFHRGIV